MQVHTAARVDEDLKRSLKVEVESCGPDKTLKVELLSEDGQMIRCQDGFKGKTSSAAETGAVTIAAVDWGLGDVVDLWWPVREGKQTRYTVKVNLVSEVRLALCFVRSVLSDNNRWVKCWIPSLGRLDSGGWN